MMMHRWFDINTSMKWIITVNLTRLAEQICLVDIHAGCFFSSAIFCLLLNHFVVVFESVCVLWYCTWAYGKSVSSCAMTSQMFNATYEDLSLFCCSFVQWLSVAELIVIWLRVTFCKMTLNHPKCSFSWSSSLHVYMPLCHGWQYFRCDGFWDDHLSEMCIICSLSFATGCWCSWLFI